MNSYHVSENNTDLKISSEVQQRKIIGKKKTSVSEIVMTALFHFY